MEPGQQGPWAACTQTWVPGRGWSHADVTGQTWAGAWTPGKVRTPHLGLSLACPRAGRPRGPLGRAPRGRRDGSGGHQLVLKVTPPGQDRTLKAQQQRHQPSRPHLPSQLPSASASSRHVAATTPGPARDRGLGPTQRTHVTNTQHRLGKWQNSGTKPRAKL